MDETVQPSQNPLYALKKDAPSQWISRQTKYKSEEYKELVNESQIETSSKIKLIFLDAELGYCLNVSGGIDSGTLLYCIRKTMTDPINLNHICNNNTK